MATDLNNDGKVDATDDLLAAIAAAPAAPTDEARVWWGGAADKVAVSQGGKGWQDFLNTKALPAKQVVGYMAQLRATDVDQYNKYIGIMQRRGLVGRNPSSAEVDKVWVDALGVSGDLLAAGYYFAPWEALELMSDNKMEEEKGFTGTRSVPFNRTSTNTDTRRSVDLSSESEARAFILAAAERELGRAATASEIAAFRRALNAEERANPEVTVNKGTETTSGSSTQQVVDGEVVSESSTSNSASSSSSTSSGGLERGQYAMDYARSADDWAEYKAATTYANALFAALGSPVNVEG